MIDQNARNQLQNLQVAKQVTASIDKLGESLKGGVGNGASPYVLANEFNALRKLLSEEALTKIESLVKDLNSKIAELNKISADLPRAIEMNFPTEYPVRGSVEVQKMPPVTVSNLGELSTKLQALLSVSNNFQVNLNRMVEKMSKEKSVGPMEIKGMTDLIDGIEELKKGFNLLLNKEGVSNEGPMEVAITNFPPQMVPQPVTNISINGLGGFAKSRAVTVTTALTPLPGEVLADRRSLVVYNNSASTTIFVGGSDVSAANGMPVPAGTYSPAIDCSQNLIVYAVTATGSADVRTLELSDIDTGR